MIKFKKAAREAANKGIDLSVLGRVDGVADGKNLGGAFRLPPEFPIGKFASAFREKGSDVEAAKQTTVLEGTDVTAPGWSVWLYPEGENKGKPHEVATRSGTFILMFRPIEVQEAVNYVFGEASRARMNAEVHGETVAGTSPDDAGVLTEEHLSRIPALRAERETISREREMDERGGRKTSVFAGQRPVNKVIKPKKTKLTKS